MTRYFTSSKSLGLLVVLILAGIAVEGCSSDPPKSGVAIKAGDYDHAPGGGKAPAKPATN